MNFEVDFKSSLAMHNPPDHFSKMDTYDSDSSAGEDSPYTETNVLLGYASKEPTDDTVSHLGGYPVCTELNYFLTIAS
jgi:hypothetical protein